MILSQIIKLIVIKFKDKNNIKPQKQAYSEI